MTSLSDIDKAAWELVKCYNSRGNKGVEKNYKYIDNPGIYDIADIGLLPNINNPKILYLVTVDYKVFLVPTSGKLIEWFKSMYDIKKDPEISLFPSLVKFKNETVTIATGDDFPNSEEESESKESEESKDDERKETKDDEHKETKDEDNKSNENDNTNENKSRSERSGSN